MNLDTHGLDRFVEAQDRVYRTVCDELRAGRKQSHWMWFVFPQLAGLGRSAIARHFGFASEQEVQHYWQRPVLQGRLLECTRLVMAHRGDSAHAIFGSPDDLKFRSCMTLFQAVVPAAAAPEAEVFGQAIEAFFGGSPDEATLRLLRACAGSADAC
ncbi:MAG: DUF1810 domain-containing protein [Burkholderiaceae bacterium]